MKGVRLVDAGDVITPTANVTQSLANVTSAIATIVKGGAMPVTIGDQLAALAAKGRIVGFDITEVSPPYDRNNETSLLASYVGLRFLGSIFEHRAK